MTSGRQQFDHPARASVNVSDPPVGTPARRIICCVTTVAGGQALLESLRQGIAGIGDVRSLQEYHA